MSTEEQSGLDYVPEYLPDANKERLIALTRESESEPAPLAVDEYLIRHWCETLEDAAEWRTAVPAYAAAAFPGAIARDCPPLDRCWSTAWTVATGSLGQGLPIGVGMGLAAKYLDRLPSHVWVLCGDSEMAEGSMWEAFEHASHYELDNLTAIVDVNGLGQIAALATLDLVEGGLIAVGPLPSDDLLGLGVAFFEAKGLVYYDEFFELSGNWPEWLRLYAMS